MSHCAAHNCSDPKIASAGNNANNGGLGMAPIGEIIDISLDAIGNVRPHCKEEAKQKVDEAFKGVDRSKYGRTTQQPPKPGTDAHNSLSTGDKHTTVRTSKRK